jgi:hypothetical protein
MKLLCAALQYLVAWATAFRDLFSLAVSTTSRCKLLAEASHCAIIKYTYPHLLSVKLHTYYISDISATIFGCNNLMQAAHLYVNQ